MHANLHLKTACAWKQREPWHIIAPCLGGAVLISRHLPRCAFVFQSGVGDPYRALSIIHLTCHHGKPPSHPREATGARVQTETPEVWMDVNLNGRKTTTEERERKDDRWQARMGWKERSRGRVDNKEAEGWQVIVAEGVKEKRWRAEERMSKCIDIPHRTVSSHLKGSLWL